MPSVFTTADAARYLSVSKSALEHWRIVGRGPAFIRVGKNVRYRPDALEAFLSDNTVDPNKNPGSN